MQCYMLMCRNVLKLVTKCTENWWLKVSSALSECRVRGVWRGVRDVSHCSAGTFEGHQSASLCHGWDQVQWLLTALRSHFILAVLHNHSCCENFLQLSCLCCCSNPSSHPLLGESRALMSRWGGRPQWSLSCPPYAEQTPFPSTLSPWQRPLWCHDSLVLQPPTSFLVTGRGENPVVLFRIINSPPLLHVLPSSVSFLHENRHFIK